MKHSILLERLRLRHLKGSTKPPETRNPKPVSTAESENEDGSKKKKKEKRVVGNFEELGLSEEVMGAVREMGIEVPTEIQCIGVPAVLEGKSVVLGSHTGSGKTLAYMLPLVQVLVLHVSLLIYICMLFNKVLYVVTFCFMGQYNSCVWACFQLLRMLFV